ncbi:MAG: hypothetical protein KDI52_03665 [Xanthomonadales bacterium]|nr:hypothetical protein [Xanthomonadales bacterium]
MKYLKIITCSFVLFFSALSAQEKTESYFPINEITNGKIWTLGIDTKAASISQIIIEELNKNKDWIKNYIEQLSLKPGELMPYHKNFGVSEEEYDYFLKSINDIKLIEVDEVIMIKKTKPDGFELAFDNSKLPIKKITYNKKNNTISTTSSVLKDITIMNQQDESSPLGRWHGIQWKHEKFISESDFIQEKIAFGKVDEKEEGIMYYDIKSSNRESSYFVITYNL